MKFAVEILGEGLSEYIERREASYVLLMKGELSGRLCLVDG